MTASGKELTAGWFVGTITPKGYAGDRYLSGRHAVSPERKAVDNSISIKREDSLAMLTPPKRFTRKKETGDAALTMEGCEFVISLSGVSTGTPATGNWAGKVCVPARLIWGIAMAPPS